MVGNSTSIADPEARIADISGFLNVQHARLVHVVEQAIDQGHCTGAGIHTPAQWLAVRAGVSPARAKLIVRVAEGRQSFPKVFAAFEAPVDTSPGPAAGWTSAGSVAAGSTPTS